MAHGSVHRHEGPRGVSWRIRYDGPDTRGHRRQRQESGFGTRKEAERALRERLTQIEQGMLAGSVKQTMRDYLTAWLAGKRHSIRPTTQRTYAMLIRAYLIPQLGAVRLDRLTHEKVQECYDALLVNHESSTVNAVHRLLRSALTAAKQSGMIAYNVTDRVPAPRIIRRPMHAWDVQQTRDFERALAGHPMQAYFLLAIRTGMRRGELLGLRWCDVRLNDGIARIEQQVVPLGSQWYVGPPKSAAGVRAIDLDPTVSAALVRQQARSSIPTRDILSLYSSKR